MEKKGWKKRTGEWMAKGKRRKKAAHIPVALEADYEYTFFILLDLLRV